MKEEAEMSSNRLTLLEIEEAEPRFTESVRAGLRCLVKPFAQHEIARDCVADAPPSQPLTWDIWGVLYQSPLG